ncbi:MAG: hypothetical protein ACRDB0_00010 [Paraclostridium sp.]
MKKLGGEYIKISIIVTIVLVLPIMFILTTSKIENDELYKVEKEYLKENSLNITLKDTNDFSGLEILKDDLKDKKIIFTGEDHTLDKDNLVKVKMIKYLKKEININYILSEIGYSDAYFLNKYLESGDETILNQFFNHVKGTAMYNVDDYNTYKELYEFNQTLKEEDRIKVVGVDIEHGGSSSYDYINEIIINKDIKSDNIKNLLDTLERYDNRELKEEALKSVVEAIQNDVIKNEDLYLNIFGLNIENFKYILNNLKAMCISYSSEEKDWNNVRDKFIYENFKSIDSKLVDAKYFGQWGSFHIYKDTINEDYYNIDTEFIASHLNKDEDYKDKIISIQYGYYGTGANKTNYYTHINKKLFSDYIDTSSDAIIFKLNGNNSPFNKSDIYPFEDSILNNTKKVTTDYIDYTIMIKEAKKSKLLDI